MKTHDPRRRAVLRGTFAADGAPGCRYASGTWGEWARSAVAAPAVPLTSSARSDCPDVPAQPGSVVFQRGCRRVLARP